MFSRRIDNRQRELNTLREDIRRQPQETTEETTYEPLAAGNPRWDKEMLGFRGASSSDLHQRLLAQVDGVQALFMRRKEFSLLEDTRAFRMIPEEQRGLALLAWKLQREHQNAALEYQNRQKLLTFCRKQNELIQKSQFVSVQWTQLCNVLGVSDLAEGYTALVDQIKKSQANQTDLQKSLTEINRMRSQLQQQFTYWNATDLGDSS